MNREEIELLGWEWSYIESLPTIDIYYLTTAEEETYRLSISEDQIRIVHKSSVRSSKLIYICHCNDPMNRDLKEIMDENKIFQAEKKSQPESELFYSLRASTRYIPNPESRTNK